MGSSDKQTDTHDQESQDQINTHAGELAIRDILDSQLVTSQGRHISRVADIEGEWQPDGTLRLTTLVIGPQALAGRIAGPLYHLVTRLFHDRFEHHISFDEVEKWGPTICLRGNHYQIDRSEDWIARTILRWIPGSGYEQQRKTSPEN